MTEGPAPSEASSSGTSNTPVPQTVPLISHSGTSSSLATYQTPSPANPTPGFQTSQYASYGTWGNTWSSNYPGYATTAAHPPGSYYAHTNPYTMAYTQPNSYNPYSHLATKNMGQVKFESPNPSARPVPPPPRIPTPPLPEPETYRHWDDLFVQFFERTKMAQTLKGLHHDFLVMNSEWEQKTIPEALKELAEGIQVILNRVSQNKPVNKPGDEDVVDVRNIDNPTLPEDERRLEERKLSYIQLSNGREAKSRSSINKSISQFLSRTRARNDASNRAEFLQSLADKKRKLLEEAAASSETDLGTTKGLKNVSSCARVDAKTIDREKQIKYDIWKNEAGPLMKTVTSKNGPSDSASSALSAHNAPPRTTTTDNLPGLPQTVQPQLLSQPRKKRRLDDLNDMEEASPILNDHGSHLEDNKTTTACLPGIDERIWNIEEHVAVRYVPSKPKTLLARISYLEDHLIKLEKEYPPWAALHFNQPNRGWPPPPRATPIIVPPHLRSTGTSQPSIFTTNDSVQAAGYAAPATGIEPSSGTTRSTKGKARAKNSTLHKAVMDRLEVQNAMNDIGGKSGKG